MVAAVGSIDCEKTKEKEKMKEILGPLFPYFQHRNNKQEKDHNDDDSGADHCSRSILLKNRKHNNDDDFLRTKKKLSNSGNYNLNPPH